MWSDKLQSNVVSARRAALHACQTPWLGPAQPRACCSTGSSTGQAANSCLSLIDCRPTNDLKAAPNAGGLLWLGRCFPDWGPMWRIFLAKTLFRTSLYALDTSAWRYAHSMGSIPGSRIVICAMCRSAACRMLKTAGFLAICPQPTSLCCVPGSCSVPCARWCHAGCSGLQSFQPVCS